MVLAVVDVDFTMATLEAFVASAAEFKSFSLVCGLKALTYKNRRLFGTFRSCTDSAPCCSTPTSPHRTCRRTFWGTRSGSCSPRIDSIRKLLCLVLLYHINAFPPVQALVVLTVVDVDLAMVASEALATDAFEATFLDHLK